VALRWASAEWSNLRVNLVAVGANLFVFIIYPPVFAEIDFFLLIAASKNIKYINS
jgi:hypothetical protein